MLGRCVIRVIYCLCDEIHRLCHPPALMILLYCRFPADSQSTTTKNTWLNSTTVSNFNTKRCNFGTLDLPCPTGGASSCFGFSISSGCDAIDGVSTGAGDARTRTHTQTHTLSCIHTYECVCASVCVCVCDTVCVYVTLCVCVISLPLSFFLPSLACVSALSPAMYALYHRVTE